MSILSLHKKMTDFCVGCGACLGVCPKKAIQIENKEGVLTVSFNHSNCVICSKCVEICPVLSNIQTVKSDFYNALGAIKKVFFGYSANVDVRYHGASGGIVTALLLYMLQHKMVDKVLVVRMKGFTAEPLLTDNLEDAISAQGSIYFKTFSLRLLPEIIRDLRKGKNIAIVGLPCQISTLKKLLKNFKTKTFFIGLICNHTNEPWYLWHMLKKYLPEKAKPLAIGSRKDGWPGGIKILFNISDGNFQELTIPLNTGVWGLLPSLNISAPLGCLICADHLASTADIVAGDAWHPKYFGKDSTGVSILIVRTDKGLKLLNSAIKDGTLYIEEARLLDLFITQGHNIIEGSQYAPFKQKLFQHRSAIAYELKDIDKTLIVLLAVINYYALKHKTIRQLLSKPLTERLLKIVSMLLSRCESIRLLKVIETLKTENT